MAASPTPVDLPALLEAVQTARKQLAVARDARSTPTSASAAGEQRALWEALESYAGALGCLGVPVPYRMRDELSMYRAMFAIRRAT